MTARQRVGLHRACEKRRTAACRLRLQRSLDGTGDLIMWNRSNRFFLTIGAALTASAFACQSHAAVITFTGGTVVRLDATLETTNNAAIWDNVDYYDEGGFRFDFLPNTAIGFSTNIGDYYGVGNDVIHAHWDTGLFGTVEWHEDYTLPSLWKFYEPSKISHGSYWHYWGTEQEVEWKNNFKLWMTFINEYKNRGGRVTVGTDSGFIYQLYGFAYPREMELLREAGFHPLEVIRAATLNGAEALGWDDKIGSVQIGKLADFVIVEENPLVNLKVLYGTGAIKLTDANEVVRVGGVKYTIKDGIIYDAKRLLADVKAMVDAEKAKTNWKLKQPGVKD
jgi:hypothetical protein